MSSGFVSGGTVDNPTERDDEWRRAQAELEATRKAKADLAAQHDGKSLFEILQENKDKKQAEFEERARYKLHVSLDDEEADYLDSLKEKQKKEEATVRKETQERLEAFRRQQEEEARKALEGEGTDVQDEDQVQWTAPNRKRKKGPETSLLKGVKLRKSTSTSKESKVVGQPIQQETQNTGKTPKPSLANKDTAAQGVSPKVAGPPASHVAPSGKPTYALSLGLGYASSDDED
jgi:hypothetical protein